MSDINLKQRLAELPKADKALLGGFFSLALLALAVGVIFGLVIAADAAGWIKVAPNSAFKFLTLHASMVFYYWLYSVQAGVILALILAYTQGAKLTSAWRGVAWFGLALMVTGVILNVSAVAGGAAVLYSAVEPLSEQMSGSANFFLGYVLLSAGLILTALTGLSAAIRPKLQGVIKEWSSISYAGFLWEVLLIVASVISLLAYVPALQLAYGAQPFIPGFSYSMSWAVMFHNMHYLPLMSTVLVWYALAEATTGMKSLFGERFSKVIFSIYLIIIPPTSLYHMFLEPGVSSGTKMVGSLLSTLMGVPTIAVFLLIVTSLQACANGRGARGMFGWLRFLPWRNPAFSAIAMAPVSAMAGGVLAYVLIQERFAPLLSDTFMVPGYFHFFTVGTITLTFLGALLYMIPALTGRRIWLPSLASVLPYLLTAGVYIFGVAGVWAGYQGAPRRALEFTYGGAAPASWAVLMSVLGIGALIMTVALILYLTIIVVSSLRDVRVSAGVEDLPRVYFNAEDAVGQKAWFGVAAVSVLLVAMYLVTIAAFRLMQSLPIS